jgi:hypothetical protein
MRPIPAALVQMASELTARYPHAHGAPLHVGSPDAIGIADLGRPDYGDPVADEVPVFWACHAWACVHRGDSTPCRPNSQRFRQSCAIQLSAAVPLDSIILVAIVASPPPKPLPAARAGAGEGRRGEDAQGLNVWYSSKNYREREA